MNRNPRVPAFPAVRIEGLLLTFVIKICYIFEKLRKKLSIAMEIGGISLGISNDEALMTKV